jgi:phosphinothricin acetyltransferase
MNEHQIRISQEKDIAVMLHIYDYYVKNSLITFDHETPDEESFRKKIQAILLSYPVLVYEINHEVVGYAYASLFREKKAYQWTVESTIYLLPKEKSKGIGSVLYSKLFSILKLQKIRSVIAVITIPNEESIRFHQKHGFTSCGMIEDIGYKFEQWRSIEMMRLILPQTASILKEPILLKDLSPEIVSSSLALPS